jgi:transketolase
MPLDPLDEKYKAFNWKVEVIDGNDMKEILRVLKKAKNNRGKPLMIIANTIPGKGVDFMENDYTWHGKPPKPEEAETALAEIHAREVELRNDWPTKHNKLKPIHNGNK